ncbi:CubicO group peptidase, beta-lactamase class C family [Robiginitalea myxolifaciens]|uniref:CubicO group peptidase, beta-lactamase class C family n=1 Tax=Robiginitalea myxolifaciens TaxID=400055 RepID=A0A1I6FQQ6_9FLAO|nr:serine hydrolase domain-containing protein [Robiginitalea myxolifaciens]SFR32285.1 CubicO group peptidase, beta-lactamase class C family [Robiginitalea myxolifaciens]
MKSFVSLLLVCTLLISCKQNAPENADATANESDTLAVQLDTYFNALTELDEFNGVILATRGDSLLLAKAYNLNEDPGSSTYVTAESQFDIHSVTKLMARYLLVKLELEEKASRKQTLDEFLPDFPMGDQITLEMLLDHVSGLPRDFEGYEGDALDMTPEEIVFWAQQQEFLFTPGTDYQYSNVGYEMVYYVLEAISGKPFAQYLQNEIFEPLGMEDTGSHFYTQQDNLRRLAKNHQLVSDSLVQVPNILPEELRTSRIYSTAHDLNLFLDHVKQEPYVSLLRDESGIIEKNGGSDGIRAQIYTDVAADFNFVLLANYDEMPFQRTIVDMVALLNGDPYQVPKAINRTGITLPDEILEQYEGTYYFADMDIPLEFKAASGGLEVFQDGESIGILQAESDSVFFEDPKAAESFEFLQDEDGAYFVMMGWKGIKLKGVLEN